MRELHVIEQAPGRVVLATADGAEQFELLVDQALRAALGNAEPSAPAPLALTAAPSEPGISPREIQIRVRAGETPEQIANDQAAPLPWVQRFAEPVLAERRRVADEARRAKARRSTAEGQTVVFGEAVDDRFAQHGIDPGTVRWDSHRTGDGQWTITARWIGGQSERTAEWALQLSSRTVSPADDTAADLLSDRPIRALAPSGNEDSDENTDAPPLAPGLIAFPVLSDAHTGPLPAEDVFDQERVGTPDPFEQAVYEPHLPMDLPPAETTMRMPALRNLGVAARGGESEEDRAARASVPSWDDILLGVRRKRD